MLCVVVVNFNNSILYCLLHESKISILKQKISNEYHNRLSVSSYLSKNKKIE